VFGSSTVKLVKVGDIISLSGTVSEFRSNPNYIYLTEITAAKNITVLSQGNTVTPYVIGVDTLSPPTEQYTSLDNGDTFGYPNNVSQISTANPQLDPTKYGLDFWESLCGELVTVRNPTALGRPNNFRETWVVGDWKVTGKNSRGGLTTRPGDANPEAIIIGSPLDGTKNPTTIKLGDSLEEITGVVTQTFGYYYILPKTAIKVTGSVQPATPPPTTLTTTGRCSDLTVGDYNVENMCPTTPHLPKVADHIVNYMKTPALLFLQEIQDDDCDSKDDGVVDANKTLSTLVAAISAISNVTYSFVDIDPVNDQDGGAPGGNIRQAYLYNPTILRLHKPNPGGSLDANAFINGELKYNPGRIDPTNIAWNSSRKPLAAAWETVDGKNKFFTINVHFASKGGSTTIEGDARPPVNGVIDPRIQQATITGNFIRSILAQNPTANIITSGDFNEFTFVKPMQVFQQRSLSLDLDFVAGIPAVERYTYLFEMNSQQLDHFFVSPAIAAKALLGRVKYEHIHINTWANAADEVSDHDPSVAKLDLCKVL
jgi:predicted extracellular nuclease